mgnify:CR=1 FL=1
MIEEHPSKYYTQKKKLENSRFGTVHLMQRKDNKQLLVLKDYENQ